MYSDIINFYHSENGIRKFSDKEFDEDFLERNENTFEGGVKSIIKIINNELEIENDLKSFIQNVNSDSKSGIFVSNLSPFFRDHSKDKLFLEDFVHNLFEVNAVKFSEVCMNRIKALRKHWIELNPSYTFVFIGSRQDLYKYVDALFNIDYKYLMGELAKPDSYSGNFYIKNDSKTVFFLWHPSARDIKYRNSNLAIIKNYFINLKNGNHNKIKK